MQCEQCSGKRRYGQLTVRQRTERFRAPYPAHAPANSSVVAVFDGYSSFGKASAKHARYSQWSALPKGQFSSLVHFYCTERHLERRRISAKNGHETRIRERADSDRMQSGRIRCARSVQRLRRLRVLQECLVTLERLVYVGFARDFPGGVHRQDGHTRVNDVHAVLTEQSHEKQTVTAGQPISEPVLSVTRTSQALVYNKQAKLDAYLMCFMPGLSKTLDTRISLLVC